jgi:hypothetical protein
MKMKRWSPTSSRNTATRTRSAAIGALGQADYAIECDGELFAGVHHIIDMWAPSKIDDLGFIETALKKV